MKYNTSDLVNEGKTIITLEAQNEAREIAKHLAKMSGGVVYVRLPMEWFKRFCYRNKIQMVRI